MLRRQYVSIVTIAATGSIAGCVGSNDNNSSDGQSPVESGEVSRNSADHYVEVEEGDTIRIETTNEETGRASTVQLYDPDGEQIFEREVEDTDTATHQVERNGDFRVIIATGGTASYEIYVESN